MNDWMKVGLRVYVVDGQNDEYEGPAELTTCYGSRFWVAKCDDGRERVFHVRDIKPLKDIDPTGPARWKNTVIKT